MNIEMIDDTRTAVSYKVCRTVGRKAGKLFVDGFTFGFRHDSGRG